jgi:nucleoside-diphosphate-sugar epimerase
MRIAIFGERGMIGQALVASAPAGCQIAAFNLPAADVRRRMTFADALTKFEPEVVINLAAILGGVVAGESVQQMFETNVMGALTVAYAAKEAGARSYIFTSSTVAHGGNEPGKHHRRFDGFAPRHAYGASKAAAELALQQLSKEAGDLRFVAVRPPQIIGESSKVLQPPEQFVQEAAAGKDIVLFGDGLHEREYVATADVAGGIWKAVQWSLTADRGYHPFFLTGNRVSMKDLAETVARKFGTKVIFMPKTAQAFTLTTDPSESWAILGWKVSSDLERILVMFPSLRQR